MLYFSTFAMDFRSQRCRQWFQIPSSIYLRLFGRFSGWRGTLKLLCLLSWLLAIPTLGVSIYLWIHDGITGKSITVVTIRSGPCESIVSADTWIHLVMNVLSSSLLAATVSPQFDSLILTIHVSFNPLTIIPYDPIELRNAGLGCPNALQY